MSARVPIATRAPLARRPMLPAPRVARAPNAELRGRLPAGEECNCLLSFLRFAALEAGASPNSPLVTMWNHHGAACTRRASRRGDSAGPVRQDRLGLRGALLRQVEPALSRAVHGGSGSGRPRSARQEITRRYVRERPDRSVHATARG